MHFVNGRWYLYSTVFEASGVPYETFVLDGLRSDSNDEQYIADGYIRAFVTDETGDVSTLKAWTYDSNELFV